MNLETFKVLTDWTARTEYILRLEKRKLDVDDTHELDNSLDSKVERAGNDMLKSEIGFLVRGRFVDMGAGRKSSKIETRDGNARLLKVRKPKKWYSRAFWGRINDLQGVLGFKLMEAAIRSVKDPLEDRPVRGTLGRPKL
jgi:hypothetical protein